MIEGTRPVESPTARFYRHRIGEVELIALSDGGLNYPAAMILGSVPPEGVAAYNLPEKQIFIPYTILLVKTKDKLLLNDVGAGDLGNPGDNIFELLVSEARKAFNAIKDQVTLVQEGGEVLPGIRVEATYGHTPGHVMISISAGEQTVYNISDVVVDPLFVEHPEWAPAIDMDAGQADKVRRRFFAAAAGENALVFAHHLGPFPNLGRIMSVGDSWQWRPIGITA